VTSLLTKIEQVLSFDLPHIDNVFPEFRIGEFAVLYGHSLVKTLSFRLSVRCQLSAEEGGLNSTAIYLDGGNTFNPYAISAVAQQHDLDPRITLERILVSRAFTAYQLAALIFETLEGALKKYKSKLVFISDIMSLFLDSDVPTKEALDIFIKAIAYLSDLMTKRKVLIVASYFPYEHSRRRVFLESVLFGRASTVTRVQELKGQMQFKLEKHPFLQPFIIDVVPNAATLEKFVEA
jgi:hypothetical protein